MSKKYLRQELVYHCLTRRYSDKQTLDYLREKTNTYISERTLRRVKDRLKDESRQYFFTLAKDNDEAYLELKTRIDSTKQIIKSLYQDFEDAQGNFFARTKIADQILREESKIQEWFELLTFERGTGNNVISKEQDSKEYSDTF